MFNDSGMAPLTPEELEKIEARWRKADKVIEVIFIALVAVMAANFFGVRLADFIGSTP